MRSVREHITNKRCRDLNSQTMKCYYDIKEKISYKTWNNCANVIISIERFIKNQNIPN